MKNLTPPKWAPYAVATEQGWTNPKTGEILVALKGLKSRIEAVVEAAQPPVMVLDIDNPVECTVENAFIEIVTEPVSEEPQLVEEIIEKRGRGRPRKNRTENDAQDIK